jgi:hypothetical protein
MSATLFHKITDSFAGALFVGHSEGELLFLEQVSVRADTPAHLVDATVHALLEMKTLAGSTVAAPSHIVRFMDQVGIVTPYFEAVPLRVVQAGARAKRLSCPPGVALKIVLDIVDGLCQYHNLETALSGGVCPDQILVGTDGDTRVGNVAVAAMPTKDSPWRANVDRLAYLAPEQTSAQTHCDGHTDVYAVGVILWELLCNQPRFIASASRILEMLRSISGSPQLAPLDSTRLAPALVATLSRALHPQPALRQSTMGRLARELLECGQELASNKEVAAFVERVAGHSLRALRSAIQAQAVLLDVPALTSQLTSQRFSSDVPLASVGPSTTPPMPERDEEHTSVYHVTADLLELAKRNAGPSEPPKLSGLSRHSIPITNRVLKISDAEELSDDGKTVTFKVPQELLDQARRLFEAQEGIPVSTEAIAEGDRESIANEVVTDSMNSPAALQVAAPSQSPRHIPPFIEEESTTVWKPDFSQIASVQPGKVALKELVAASESASFGVVLWWGAVVCLALALVVAALRRMGFV